MTNANLFDRIAERRGVLLCTGDLEMTADLRHWARQRPCSLVEISLPDTKYLLIRAVSKDPDWSIALVFVVEVP